MSNYEHLEGILGMGPMAPSESSPNHHVHAMACHGHVTAVVHRLQAIKAKRLGEKAFHLAEE